MAARVQLEKTGSAALLAALILLISIAQAQGPLSLPAASQSDSSALPLSFAPNRGQVDERVRYYAQTGGSGFYFTRDRIAIALPGKEGRGHALHLRFVGANPSPAIEASGRREGKLNYLGKAESQTNVPTFGEIRYRELWPGIDMALRGSGGTLKYEFHVAPGADPADIRLAYAGAESLSLGAAGALLVETPLGTLTDQAPKTYQRSGGRNVAVESSYAISPAGHRYGFNVSGYDRARALVIDPGIDYSSVLGGTGEQDFAVGVAVDDGGNAYVTGWAGEGFPTTPGAYSAGGYYGFVTKFTPDGSSLVYSTYLPVPTPSSISALAVDAEGNAFVTGYTTGQIPTTPGAFQPLPCGDTCGAVGDGFVMKLNASGSALVYATYLGGGRGEGLAAIRVDAAGNAYIAGSTRSDDFPVTAGAYDTTHSGAGIPDGFVTKMNPTGTGLVYSTFLGTGVDDDIYDMAVDSQGSAYVSGNTLSNNFPVTPGAVETLGAGDGFVTKFTPDGSGLAYSTYLGGDTGPDYATDIAVDAGGNAYVAGSTRAPNFSTTPGAFDTIHNGESDGFVTKLNATASARLYSTFIGGEANDGVSGVGVDAGGQAYVTGGTSSTGFPITPGAFDATPDPTNGDAFVTVLEADGSSLAHSTFLGGSSAGLSGSSADAGNDIAVGGSSAWVAGSTRSSNFPTTPSAFDTSNNGGRDAFVARVSGLASAILVQLEAAPDDPQDFSFSAGGGLSPASFQLDDDSDPTLSSQRMFAVAPGSGYSIAEANPGAAGWYIGKATCSDGSPITNIGVSDGEIVTCTFINSRTYPRPGGATPIRIPLVVAYKVCGAAQNSVHAPPLDLGSCSPPLRASDLLTTSSVGRQTATAVIRAIPGDAATPAIDEADVQLSVSISDVIRASSGLDYVGPLLFSAQLRFTDRANAPEGVASATSTDLPFSIPFNCVATPEAPLGASCNLDTSVEALVPGFAIEGKRAVIRARGISLKDTGPDENIGSGSGCPPTCGTGDERTYQNQGLFAP